MKATAEEIQASQHDQRADNNPAVEEIQRLCVLRSKPTAEEIQLSGCLMARQEVDCRGRCSVSAHSECRGDSSV